MINIRYPSHSLQNLHEICNFYDNLTFFQLLYDHQAMEVFMKFGKYFLFLLVVLIIATPVLSKTAKTTTKKGNHPVPMENQSCENCHEGSLSYEQWQKSVHGLNLVKCEVCHGEQSNFKRIPSDSVCRGCHSDQFSSIPAGKTCATCHPAHLFNVHKMPNIKQ